MNRLVLYLGLALVGANVIWGGQLHELLTNLGLWPGGQAPSNQPAGTPSQVPAPQPGPAPQPPPGGSIGTPGLKLQPGTPGQ